MLCKQPRIWRSLEWFLNRSRYLMFRRSTLRESLENMKKVTSSDRSRKKWMVREQVTQSRSNSWKAHCCCFQERAYLWYIRERLRSQEFRRKYFWISSRLQHCWTLFLFKHHIKIGQISFDIYGKRWEAINWWMYGFGNSRKITLGKDLFCTSSLEDLSRRWGASATDFIVISTQASQGSKVFLLGSISFPGVCI